MTAAELVHELQIANRARINITLDVYEMVNLLDLIVSRPDYNTGDWYNQVLYKIKSSVMHDLFGSVYPVPDWDEVRFLLAKCSNRACLGPRPEKWIHIE